MTESDVGNTASQREGDDDQPADDENVFVGKLEGHNFKNMIRILKSVVIRKAATFYVTERGLKIVIQEMGNFQVAAYLQKEIFEHFQCRPREKPEVCFLISLEVLLNCLQMFGEAPGDSSATTCQFSYKGEGNSLCVQLEQNGSFTSCDIKTINDPAPVDVQFLAQNLHSRIICKSDCMRDALNGLFAFPSTSLEVHLTSTEPYFLMRVISDNVTSEATISKNSDYVENFWCEKNTFHRYRDHGIGGLPKNETDRQHLLLGRMLSSFFYPELFPYDPYRAALIKSAMKPLSISEKTSVRIDSMGVMALQFMIRNPDTDAISFVEIYCVPEQEPQDDDDMPAA